VLTLARSLTPPVKFCPEKDQDDGNKQEIAPMPLSHPDILVEPAGSLGQLRSHLLRLLIGPRREPVRNDRGNTGQMGSIEEQRRIAVDLLQRPGLFAPEDHERFPLLLLLLGHLEPHPVANLRVDLALAGREVTSGVMDDLTDIRRWPLVGDKVGIGAHHVIVQIVLGR
jgi:hypothetical protein